FPQQLQPLPAEVRGDSAVAGDISAGACEARYEPGPDRIAADCHHDRDRLSLSFDRRDHHICGRHDQIHLEAYQLSRQLRQSFSSGLAVANLQDDGFPFDIAKLSQPLPEASTLCAAAAGVLPRKKPTFAIFFGCASADAQRARSMALRAKPP